MNKMSQAVMVFVFCMGVTLPLIAGDKGITRNIISTFYPPTAEQQTQIAGQLQLSAEQKQQLKSVNERYRQQANELRQRYERGYQNVVALMNSESPDKQRVNDALKAFHHTHSQVLNAEVQYWMDLKTILTPAQNKKLWEMFEKSRIRRG